MLSLAIWLYRFSTANSSFTNTSENIKTYLNANITIKEGEPIVLKVSTINNNDSIYNNITVTEKSENIPVQAINKPLDIERIITQLKKDF